MSVDRSILFIGRWIGRLSKFLIGDNQMGHMKEIFTDVQDYMDNAGKNLIKASESNDAELMAAVLINTKSTIDSYINALKRVGV